MTSMNRGSGLTPASGDRLGVDTRLGQALGLIALSSRVSLIEWLLSSIVPAKVPAGCPTRLRPDFAGVGSRLRPVGRGASGEPGGRSGPARRSSRGILCGDRHLSRRESPACAGMDPACSRSLSASIGIARVRGDGPPLSSVHPRLSGRYFGFRPRTRILALSSARACCSVRSIWSFSFSVRAPHSDVQAFFHSSSEMFRRPCHRPRDDRRFAW